MHNQSYVMKKKAVGMVLIIEMQFRFNRQQFPAFIELEFNFEVDFVISRKLF